MIEKPKIKLLLVVDSKLAKFYLAEDFKITRLIKEDSSEDLLAHHHRQERSDGRFAKSGSNPRFFDKHSDAKDLDREEFCKLVMHEVVKLFEESHYDQLILVCGPKVLGDLRRDIPHSLKNVDIKECIKELIHDDIRELEDKVLGSLKFK
jgi:protein required for attachment to host cells